MTNDRQDRRGYEGDRTEVSLIGEIRCSSCDDKSQRRIAVVYSDGRRRWLLMNPPRPEEGRHISLTELIRGNANWPGIRFADELDELLRDSLWLVMELEDADKITDTHAWISITCPRCCPSGFGLSWMLDCREIASRTSKGKFTKLMAADITADGSGKQLLDRDLGYRPHNDYSQIEEWKAILESRRVKPSE